jgi:PD-(D/E)XK nuclease superfamily
MRLCGLRAALATTHEAFRWILHDPRAWLGTAFHAVMKAVRSGTPASSAEAVWNSAISRASSAASRHPLDRRFSLPERWPSYYLVRQRSLALASQARQAMPKPAAQGGPAPQGPERFFEARGGRLVGRPDYYDGHTITEYKSALPDPARAGAAAIIESFRRQLRLYAAIIGEATGRRPEAARVVAASGQVLEVDLNADACDAEAEAAVAALNALNQDLKSGARPEEIATPCAENCSGCPFKVICPPFWDRLRDSKMQAFSDAAMDGTLQSLEEGPDGDLYTADVTTLSASVDIHTQQPIVLRKSIHGAFNRAAVGQQIRAVDFRVTPDGRMRADLSTVLVASALLPILENAVPETHPP